MSEYKPHYLLFSEAQMRAQGDQIRRWAAQSDNLILKQLAQEVIDAVKSANGGEK